MKVFIYFHIIFTVVVLSRVQLFVTVALQVPLSMELSRQDYLSGLPFPSPGDLPNPRIKSGSPALTSRFFTNCDPWVNLGRGIPYLFYI